MVGESADVDTEVVRDDRQVCTFEADLTVCSPAKPLLVFAERLRDLRAAHMLASHLGANFGRDRGTYILAGCADDAERWTLPHCRCHAQSVCGIQRVGKPKRGWNPRNANTTRAERAKCMVAWPVACRPSPVTDSHAQRVGAEVRSHMARQNLKQDALAAHMKVSQAWVSRRLTGDVEFTASELQGVAEFLGVSVAALFPEGEGAVAS